jgi:hypothetical protein
MHKRIPAIDGDDLTIPAGNKLVRSIAGFLPALVTWYVTRSWWGALGVFAIGAIAGYVISNQYANSISRTARRDADDRIIPEDLSPILARSLPVFLWAPPIAGAAAAAVFVLLFTL